MLDITRDLSTGDTELDRRLIHLAWIAQSCPSENNTYYDLPTLSSDSVRFASQGDHLFQAQEACLAVAVLICTMSTERQLWRSRSPAMKPIPHTVEELIRGASGQGMLETLVGLFHLTESTFYFLRAPGTCQ